MAEEFVSSFPEDRPKDYYTETGGIDLRKYELYLREQGYYSSTGEYIPVDDPYQRDEFGQKVLKDDGTAYTFLEYSVTKSYQDTYGRPPTAEELADGMAGLNSPQGYRRYFINTFGREPTEAEIAANINPDAPGIGGMQYVNWWDESTSTWDPTTGKWIVSGGYTTWDPVTKTWTIDKSKAGSKGSLTEGMSESDKYFKEYKEYLVEKDKQEKAYQELLEKKKTENAISLLTDLFNRYGLQSLIPKMKELAIAGASEATITLELGETPEWKERFKANEERRKKNLSVLLPGEYIELEDRYRQILRAYGLKRFDSDEYVTQFLSNDISPVELQNRVSIAVDRVQNADPLITSTLRNFYNITTQDLTAYLLNPEQELPKLEKQVTAAEIGAKMGAQGLFTALNAGTTGTGFSNVSRGTIGVEAMMQSGATPEVAAKAAQYISGVLPRAEFLSSLYGDAYDQYGQLQAEQESIQGLASAARARQRLSARERSQFGGSAGISRVSFGTQAQGNI